MNPQHQWMRVCGLAGLAVLLLSLTGFQPANDKEILLPWDAAEWPIAVGEVHARQITVKPDTALLIAVDQHSIDLMIEARGPALPEPLTVAAGNDRWGAEVLLLEAPGEYDIKIRSKKKSAWPGRYTLKTETLPAAAQPDARRDALALMSRAGQEAFRDTAEGRLQAITDYRQALEKWKELRDSSWQAETVTCLALLEIASDQYPVAEVDLLTARTLWDDLDEPRREAEALNWLGRLYQETQSAEKGRKPLEEALVLWQSVGETFDEAETQSNLGLVARRLGDLPVALASFQKSLALFRGLHIRDREAGALQNLASVYDDQGDLDTAIASYHEALVLWHDLGDPREAEVLNNIAWVQRRLGQWQEALRLYGEARERLPADDLGLRATVLNNIAYTYNEIGEPERALPYFEESLALYRKIGNRSGEVTVLNNLGVNSRKLGQLAQARTYHQQALRGATDLEDAAQQASSLERLADVDLDERAAAAALSQLDLAADLRRAANNRRAETGILQKRGQALILAGQPLEALPLLQGVLERRRAVRDPSGEAETLYILATAERALGQPQVAEAHARAALARAEDLRAGFPSPDLRASFLATRQRVYSFLIDLLIDRDAAEPKGGHAREAFAISEQARARSLLDSLRGAYAVPAGSTVPADLVIRRRALRGRLSAQVNARWKQSGAEAQVTERAIDSILTEIDAVEAEIHRHDPRVAANAPRPATLQEINGWLGPDTMLLEYALGETRSFLFTLAGSKLRVHLLPARAEIERRARAVYQDLSTARSGATEAEKASTARDSTELARILLGPVWGEMAHLRRLAVVSDGALEILPFAALEVPPPGADWKVPGGRQPLLEYLEVVSIPSATTLGLQRQRARQVRPADKLAAILADPVFSPDDPRLASGPRTARPSVTVAALLRDGEADALLPLPATRREAEAIARLAPAGQISTWLGTDASREAVLSGKLRDYGILHFATHGRADSRNPELSGLFLAQVDAAGQPRPGFLSLGDIYDLDLDAGLVVLSGCRTALGKEVRGEGLIGLTRAFQYAGVPRVVASLWPVQDRATADLMGHFYRAMWGHGHLPAAAALREAQKALRRNQHYSNPRSWAAFVLQGDWD